MSAPATGGGGGPGEDGVVLRFVFHEKRCVRSLPLHDWLLQQAHALGIPGGSAYRGIAGYGRHGVMCEEHFFELSADLPIHVVFFCSQAHAQRLLDKVEAEALSLFFALTPARFGIAGAEKAPGGGPVLPGIF